MEYFLQDQFEFSLGDHISHYRQLNARSTLNEAAIVPPELHTAECNFNAQMRPVDTTILLSLSTLLNPYHCAIVKESDTMPIQDQVASEFP